jgi:predicted TIM-barrel fold metal-dependent hydrolase
MSKPHRIDVHHHPYPPSYLAARAGEVYPTAGPQRGWSVAKSLDDMERGGVATAILSIPHPPSMWPTSVEEGRALARGWNEFMTKLAADHPGRFGVFATLPILDIEGSLRETEYSLDVLKADGINLMTNIGAKWLGDEHYAPVFEELNRRGAVIYTHPLAPTCCTNMLPELNDAMIEFGTDTTRAIAKWLFSGSAARYPDMRLIFSHAGGTMPFLVERFLRAPVFSPQDIKGRVPKGVLYELKKLYYDTAQSAHPYAMGPLARLVSATQILFGTDFPYRSAEDHVRGLAECGFRESELEAIDCGNAKRLLPKWGDGTKIDGGRR